MPILNDVSGFLPDQNQDSLIPKKSAKEQDKVSVDGTTNKSSKRTKQNQPRYEITEQ